MRLILFAAALVVLIAALRLRRAAGVVFSLVVIMAAVVFGAVPTLRQGRAPAKEAREAQDEASWEKRLADGGVLIPEEQDAFDFIEGTEGERWYYSEEIGSYLCVPSGWENNLVYYPGLTEEGAIYLEPEKE